MKRMTSLLALFALLSPLSLFAADSVDLLWQGSGYTPPFYEGHTLWGRETQITFFAVPHIHTASGAEISPSTLTYRWAKDDTILGSLSGVGKNTISFQDSILGLPIQVRVDIMDSDDTVLASSGGSFAASAPSLLIYESNPTYGYLFNHEVSQGLTMGGQEVTLAAFPLFFSVTTKTSPRVAYTWSSTGSGSQTGESVTYRVPGTDSGTSPVHATADIANILNQNATEDFLVQFIKPNAF